MSNDPIFCLHCRMEVVTDCDYSRGGTFWTHADGYQDCKPTYAAPDLAPQWASYAQSKKD